MVGEIRSHFRFSLPPTTGTEMVTWDSNQPFWIDTLNVVFEIETGGSVIVDVSGVKLWQINSPGPSPPVLNSSACVPVHMPMFNADVLRITVVGGTAEGWVCGTCSVWDQL